MKTKEEKKIVRTFTLITIWIIFAVCTLCGLITAKEQTAYISDGKEIETVKYDFFSNFTL